MLFLFWCVCRKSRLTGLLRNLHTQVRHWMMVLRVFFQLQEQLVEFDLACIIYRVRISVPPFRCLLVLQTGFVCYNFSIWCFDYNTLPCINYSNLLISILLYAARFSPDDKYSRQRVLLKKRFGLLPTQQPPPKYWEQTLVLASNVLSHGLMSWYCLGVLGILLCCSWNFSQISIGYGTLVNVVSEFDNDAMNES